MPTASVTFSTYHKHDKKMQNILDDLMKAYDNKQLEFGYCKLVGFVQYFDKKKYWLCWDTCSPKNDLTRETCRSFSNEIFKLYFNTFEQQPPAIQQQLEYIISNIYQNYKFNDPRFVKFTQSINKKDYAQAAKDLKAIEKYIRNHCSFEYLVSVFEDVAVFNEPFKVAAINKLPSFSNPKPSDNFSDENFEIIHFVMEGSKKTVVLNEYSPETSIIYELSKLDKLSKHFAVKMVDADNWELMMNQLADYNYRPKLRKEVDKTKATHKFVHLDNKVVYYTYHKPEEKSKTYTHTKKQSSTLLSRNLDTGTIPTSDVGLLFDVDKCVIKAMMTEDMQTYHREWVGREFNANHYAENSQNINYSQFSEFLKAIENPDHNRNYEWNEMLTKFSRESLNAIIVTKNDAETKKIAEQRREEIKTKFGIDLPICIYNKLSKEISIDYRPRPADERDNNFLIEFQRKELISDKVNSEIFTFLKQGIASPKHKATLDFGTFDIVDKEYDFHHSPKHHSPRIFNAPLKEDPSESYDAVYGKDHENSLLSAMSKAEVVEEAEEPDFDKGEHHYSADKDNNERECRIS